MKRRTAGLMMAVVLAVTALAGCGGKVKFEPQASSIFVRKDGTVVSADIEDFVGNNYSEAELKTYVEDAVKEYNSEHGAAAEAYVDEEDEEASLPVKIDSLTVEEGVASLLLGYEGCSDYLEFTGNDEEGKKSCRDRRGSRYRPGGGKCPVCERGRRPGG